MPFPVRAVAKLDNGGSVCLPKAFVVCWCGPWYGQREKGKMMKKLMKRFLKDEQGLELSEYAVMAALIILLIVAAIEALSGAITGAFTRVTDVVTAAGTGS